MEGVEDSGWRSAAAGPLPSFPSNWTLSPTAACEREGDAESEQLPSFEAASALLTLPSSALCQLSSETRGKVDINSALRSV